MLHGQKIAFVFIIDNDTKMVPGLKSRIWHHEKLVKQLLRDEVCIMGRKTHDITKWKGDKSWVLTRDKNWRRVGIGTLGSLDDLHLHTEAEKVFVLGGKSLFKKLQHNVDELRMYVINNREGSETFPKIKMEEWKPMDYLSEKIWSYGHLERREIEDNDDYLFE